jgi:hypothetical protein
MVGCAIEFAKGMMERGAKISSKSTVLASSMGIAREIAQQVQQATGVSLKVTISARDLGVDSVSNKRRITKTVADRLVKAKRRCKRIAVLSTKLKKAGPKLVNTVAAPPRQGGGRR